MNPEVKISLCPLKWWRDCLALPLALPFALTATNGAATSGATNRSATFGPRTALSDTLRISY